MDLRFVLGLLLIGMLAQGTLARRVLRAGPVPTKEQLAFHKGEINALIHFNMATFVQDGDPACNKDNWATSGNPATFNPVLLDTDNWVESMKALGAKSAVLTAKHGCGFLLWPTQTKLPNGQPYTYHVLPNATYKQDVLAQFAASCEKAGIGHGFYYSLTNNFYLNVLHGQVQNTTILPGQVNVTQQQFEAIALSHLTELWTGYGALTEIWFDGGYQGSLQSTLKQMLIKLQPQAVAFNGYGVSPAPICWIGTESGHAPAATWSTGVNNAGDPNSTVWCPKECDTTLQNFDHWFYTPEVGIRSLAELISVYHDSVGHNGVLELDFAIDRTGRVAPNQAQRYLEFGNWIRECYGQPVNSTTGTILTFGKGGATIDRVSIQEDQSQGQRIRAYSIYYQEVGSDKWQLASSGTSVGNKKIDLFPRSVNAQAVRLQIDAAIASPVLSRFAAYKPCSAG